jgi:hypothetical protein
VIAVTAGHPIISATWPMDAPSEGPITASPPPWRVSGIDVAARDENSVYVETFVGHDNDLRMTHPDPSQRARAVAKIVVHRSEVERFDDTTTPVLAEIHIEETFTGDIEAESLVRALQLQHDDGFATQVSLQRVRGTLGGRRGTFVLQGSQHVARGKITAAWFVVPGSGTDQLTGLRGEGGFVGEFGKGSDGTLDYWFESTP